MYCTVLHCTALPGGQYRQVGLRPGPGQLHGRRLLLGPGNRKGIYVDDDGINECDLFLFSQDTPWCFFPDNVPTPGDLCKEFHWEAAGPGFTEEEYAVMFSNYEANLNIRGTGAIIAAPDAETPGGDYRCVAAAATT